MNIPDPRGREAMVKYICLLNEVNSLGQHGFAKLLDSASPEEMTEFLRAADFVLGQVRAFQAKVPT